jgi:hypothetical protein
MGENVATIGPNGQVIPKFSTLVAGTDGTNLYPLKTDNAGVLQVSGSFVFPSGLATSANQVLEISALNTINTTLNHPFQAGGSIGNTSFGASQLGTWSVGRTWTLSNSTDSVNVGNFPATQPVTGTVTANAGTGNFTVVQPTGSNLHVVVDSMPTTTVTGTVAATQSGTWNIGTLTSITNPVTVTGSISTSFVSGAVSTLNSTSTPLGAGASFTGTAEDITSYSGVVIGLVADRAGTLNVQWSSDGTNWNPAESIAFTPSTPGTPDDFLYSGTPEAKYFRINYVNGGTAQGTFRLQTVFKVNAPTGDVSFIGVAPVAANSAVTTKSVIYGLTTGGGGGYVPVKVTPSGSLTVALGDISGVVGQQTMAASLPVAIASNQSAIPVTQSGTWNVGLNAGSNAIGSITNTTFAATQSGTWTVQPGNTANTTAWLTTQVGRATANTSAYNDYTSTSVTTAAYTQLIASLTTATSEVEIFDSSGQGMILATGAAASEVDQIYIFPGGNGRVPLKIAAGTRVAIKAKTATANVGYIMVNFYA